jgi:hypothetical protein
MDPDGSIGREFRWRWEGVFCITSKRFHNYFFPSAAITFHGNKATRDQRTENHAYWNLAPGPSEAAGGTGVWGRRTRVILFPPSMPLWITDSTGSTPRRSMAWAILTVVAVLSKDDHPALTYSPSVRAFGMLKERSEPASIGSRFDENAKTGSVVCKPMSSTFTQIEHKAPAFRHRDISEN